MSKQKIVVYMPALNEAASIAEVIRLVPKEIKGFDEVVVLVVDDGSVDATKSIALEAGAQVISHNQNKGLGNAFITAVDYCLKNKADCMVSIDSDGQFDVGQIKEIIEPITLKQADFVIGNRFVTGKPSNMPKLKYWGNQRISNIVSFVCRQKIHDASCGFRAYNRDCLLNINLNGSFTYTHEVILDLLNKNYSVAQIPVEVKYFENRVSRIANNLIRYAFRTSIIIFRCLKDYKPLQFFLAISGFVFLVSIMLGGFVTWNWYNTGMISPYKSLGFISLALSGMALMIAILAFVADFLNRIRENQEKILFISKKIYYEKD